MGFGTILAVLAMLLCTACSRCQVLLPPTARLSCTQHSLTAGCAPCAVGARTRMPLPFNHHTTPTTWLGSHGDDVQQSSSLPRAPCAPCRVRNTAGSAAHDVRRWLNVDPVLCGVVVELDRLSTGLGKLQGA